MQKVILKLFEICSFRAGPQDLPASAWLLRLVIVGSILVDSIVGVAFGKMQQAIAESLLALSVAAIALYAALHWQGKTARFLQSFTAINGAGLLISILALPLFFAMGRASVTGEPLANYVVVGLFFLVWQVGVFAHIIRHTFDIKLGYALMSIVLFVVVYGQLAGQVFPEQP